jgi:pectin methylesterase-like acyl-CoA thioesterase
LAACGASDATGDAVGSQGGGAGNAAVSGGAPSSAGGLGAGAPSGGTVATAGGGTSNGGASGASTVAGAGGAVSAGAGGTNPAGGAAQGGSLSGGAAGAGGSGGGGPLPPSVTALFPAPGATGVCLDAPLTITFASTPSVGSAGKISIFAKNNPNTAVDTVDLALVKISDVIGGQTRNLVRPVFVDGTQAVVYFHQHKLAANTTYFVTVSSGAFVDSSKAPIGTVTGDSAWSFTTGPAPSAAASMAVNRTGSGGFCTVQGAFDAVPANNTTARTITVQANKYHEILYLSGKKNLTLKGSDRTGTVIEYANNDMLNAGTSARPLFYANGANGLTIDTLTIHNSTPQGGSQAEALAVNADQVILRNSDFKSLQDTLLLTGRVYVVGSYVEGNVDFVWGSGVTYFDSCEIKTVGRAGAIVQSRNGSGGYGYVFVDSKLTSDPGITGQVLARIDATVYPYSHVAYVNCQMSSAIAAKGWTITPAGTSATGNLRFWEYQSTDASGKALNVSGRDPASKQISASQAAQMRDKATVLGGWNPQ